MVNQAKKKKIKEKGLFSGTAANPLGKGFRRIEADTAPVSEKVSGKGRTISSGQDAINVKAGENVIRRKTGRGQTIQTGDQPNFTVNDGGVSTTFFNKNLPRDSILRRGMSSGDIQVGDMADPNLNPQERLDVLQQQEFDKGLETGSFDLSEEAFNRIASERGMFQQEQPQQQEAQDSQERSFLDRVAQLGVLPAVLAANTINTIGSLVGLELGDNVTTEEIVQDTKFGKALGLGTVAAASVIAATYAATATGVLKGTAGKVATPFIQARRAVALGSMKASGTLAKLTAFGKAHPFLAASTAGFLTFNAKDAVGLFTTQRIQDLGTALETQGETAGRIREAVEQGVLSPEEGMAMLADMEELVNDSNRKIQAAGQWSPRYRFSGQAAEMQTRYTKAKTIAQLERGKIINSLTAPQV